MIQARHPRLEAHWLELVGKTRLVSHAVSFYRSDTVIKINYPGSGNNSQFVYDGFGLTGEIVETLSGTVTGTKEFVWADGYMKEARSSSGALAAQYFDLGENISGTNYIWSFDHLGSIREMTTTTGAIVDQRQYDGFGRVAQTQGSIAPDFQYTGLYHHALSSLSLATYRDYNSSMGRWINRDPLGETAAINLYGYVNNDPLIFNDLEGLQGDPTSGTATPGGTGVTNYCWQWWNTKPWLYRGPIPHPYDPSRIPPLPGCRSYPPGSPQNPCPSPPKDYRMGPTFPHGPGTGPPNPWSHRFVPYV